MLPLELIAKQYDLTYIFVKALKALLFNPESWKKTQ